MLNVIAFEGLGDLVLVDHSYGGLIITAVADAIPDKSDPWFTLMHLLVSTVNLYLTWTPPLLPGWQRISLQPR